MSKATNSETNQTYFLKLVLYMIVGSQWLWIVDQSMSQQIPIPIGIGIGLLFARHEHFKLDKKIEYAVLLISMLVGFWAGTGLILEVL